MGDWWGPITMGVVVALVAFFQWPTLQAWLQRLFREAGEEAGEQTDGFVTCTNCGEELRWHLGYPGNATEKVYSHAISRMSQRDHWPMPAEED